MAVDFAWKRFWCRREESYFLSDDGFLTDPEAEYGKELNPNLITFDRLQQTPCLALLGEPGIGKSWILKREADPTEMRGNASKTVRLDLRGFGSEDRLIDELFGKADFQTWLAGCHDLYLYLSDSATQAF